MPMKLIVNIDVPNLEAGVRFYSEAFDLVHVRTLDDDVAELVGASSIIYLLEKAAGTEATSDGATRTYERHWTPTHLDFVVKDISAAKDRIVRAGAICESACVEWRGSKCISFSDPFGHGFCVLEFSGETYNGDT